MIGILAHLEEISGAGDAGLLADVGRGTWLQVVLPASVDIGAGDEDFVMNACGVTARSSSTRPCCRVRYGHNR